MNIVQVKRITFQSKPKSIKVQNKPSLHTLLQEKYLKKKKKIKDASEKQRGTIEEAAEKQKKYLQTLNTGQQLQLIDDLFTKNFLTTEAKDELA